MDFTCDSLHYLFLLAGPPRSVHLLHNSETPASVFALLESANSNKTVALVADNLFDLLMLKMSSFYQAKKQTKIESRGPRFEAGDFLVKLGSVTMGPTFKGILVEVRFVIQLPNLVEYFKSCDIRLVSFVFFSFFWNVSKRSALSTMMVRTVGNKLSAGKFTIKTNFGQWGNSLVVFVH